MVGGGAQSNDVPHCYLYKIVEPGTCAGFFVFCLNGDLGGLLGLKGFFNF